MQRESRSAAVGGSAVSPAAHAATSTPAAPALRSSDAITPAASARLASENRFLRENLRIVQLQHDRLDQVLQEYLADATAREEHTTEGQHADKGAAQTVQQLLQLHSDGWSAKERLWSDERTGLQQQQIQSHEQITSLHSQLEEALAAKDAASAQATAEAAEQHAAIEARLQEEIADLRAQLDEAAASRVAAESAAVTNLTQQLVERSREVARMHAELVSTDSHLQHALTQLHAAQQEVDELTDTLESRQRLLLQNEQNLAKARLVAEEAAAQLVAQETALQAEQERSHTLEAELQTVQQQLEQTLNAAASAAPPPDVDDAQSIAELEVALGAYQLKLESYEAERESMQLRLEQAEAAAKRLASREANAIRKATQAKEQLQTMQRQLDEATAALHSRESDAKSEHAKQQQLSAQTEQRLTADLQRAQQQVEDMERTRVQLLSFLDQKEVQLQSEHAAFQLKMQALQKHWAETERDMTAERSRWQQEKLQLTTEMQLLLQQQQQQQQQHQQQMQHMQQQHQQQLQLQRLPTPLASASSSSSASGIAAPLPRPSSRPPSPSAARFGVPALSLGALVAQNEAKQNQSQAREMVAKAAAARAKADKERAAAKAAGVSSANDASVSTSADPAPAQRESTEEELAAAEMNDLDDTDLISSRSTDLDEPDAADSMHAPNDAIASPSIRRAGAMTALQLGGLSSDRNVAVPAFSSTPLGSPMHIRGASSPARPQAMHPLISPASASSEQQRLLARVQTLQERNLELESSLQSTRRALAAAPRPLDQAALLAFCNQHIVKALHDGWLQNRAVLHTATTKLDRITKRVGVLSVYQKFLQEKAGITTTKAKASTLTRAELERRIDAFCTAGVGASPVANGQLRSPHARSKSATLQPPASPFRVLTRREDGTPLRYEGVSSRLQQQLALADAQTNESDHADGQQR